MKIAFLSDIHSNLHALTRALALVDAAKIDEIYCLGDIVGYGGNPNECVDLIRARAKHCILGNHDLAAVDTVHAEYFTKPGRVAAEWTHSVLTPENLAFLSSLPYSIVTDICTLAHASPMNPADWQYVLSLEVAKLQFEHFQTQLCFIGHTHVPAICGENLKTFMFKKGMRFIVNVGSVGQPRDGNPDLSFGVLDTDVWEYENIRSAYDIKGAGKVILQQGLPSMLASRLKQGL